MMKQSHGSNNPSLNKPGTDDSEYIMDPKTYDDPYLVYCRDCGNMEFWLAIKDGVMTIKCTICGESVKYELE